MAEKPDLLDGTAIRVPAWVRGALGLLAIAFSALAWWLAVDPTGTPVRLAAAAVSVLLAVSLLIVVVRGRIWRWVWILPV